MSIGRLNTCYGQRLERCRLQAVNFLTFFWLFRQRFRENLSKTGLESVSYKENQKRNEDLLKMVHTAEEIKTSDKVKNKSNYSA